MSRQQSSGFSSRPSAGARPRPRHGRSVAVTVALIAGLAACGGGDDDDAADSTTASESSAVETTSAPETTAAEVTAAHDTTGTEPSDTSTDDTTTDGTADDTTGETTADDSKPETAAPGEAATDSTEGSEGATAAAAASASSDPDAAADTTGEGEADGSAPDGSTIGPTTTGPECTFEENTSLPLERCNMGPAVAVVQSILQANGYDVGIDGNFGDQTLYAVRAFQEEEGLKVDGVVGIQTWSELGIDEQFGTDANGDGVIAPDELDLTN